MTRLRREKMDRLLNVEKLEKRFQPAQALGTGNKVAAEQRR